MRPHSDLPRIMVAPNGARNGKEFHPMIPVTRAELLDAARTCAAAGAGAMHFHVRDADGKHVLDAGLYRAALAEMTAAVPKMHFQITTEAYGRYSPAEMRAVVREVIPPGVSIGVKEMMPDRVATAEDIAFYQWLDGTQTQLQNICFSPDDINLLHDLASAADLPLDRSWVLFVVGHYTSGKDSDPAGIAPFLDRMRDLGLDLDWAVCAFGKTETACLAEALRLGGKVRTGFENSDFMANGCIARDNAERVAEIAALDRVAAYGAQPSQNASSRS